MPLCHTFSLEQMYDAARLFKVVTSNLYKNRSCPSANPSNRLSQGPTRAPESSRDPREMKLTELFKESFENLGRGLESSENKFSKKCS